MEVIGVAYFQGSHLNYPIPTQKRAFSSILALTQFRRACLPMFFSGILRRGLRVLPALDLLTMLL